ncbi:hypothetical protein JWK44_08885 [Staphylococcus saprophyticus]|uniref:hypothetical protein n=1 Tax=Staphylococcus saprophyticus TaxID=29385 RepID=UPI001A8D2A92|nr:hypothetical protein [Staphylococcus saprophyticus]MBO0382631.1 hypothetical protein [Staphylococcus saprophyticus]
MMNFHDAAKQTERNKQQRLIKGYNCLIEYIDEKIYKAIQNASFETSIDDKELLFKPLTIDAKCNRDVIKALIFHYKKQGANAYEYVEERVENEHMVSFERRYLIINWEDSE